MTSSTWHDRRQEFREQAAMPLHASPNGEIIIRAFRSEDREAFRALNEAWIHDGLVIGPEDMEMLCDPETQIIGRGGWIYLAIHESEVVGCFALVPACDEMLQLVIMTVRHDRCGGGIGRALLHRAIAAARALLACSIVLETSSRLESAVRLYESMGFRRVPPDAEETAIHANVTVKLRLNMKLPLKHVASVSRSAAYLW